MIINLIKKLFVPLCLLGVVGFLMVTIFGNQSSVVHEYTNSYGQTYYAIDIKSYLENVSTALYGRELWEAFSVELPTSPALNANYAVNTGIYLVNILILLINVTLLLPLKIIIYPLNIIFALLGVDSINNGLYNTLTTIAGFEIPYIKLL